MGLEVHRLDESDFPDFVRIQMSAFASGTGMTSLLTPSPLPSDYIQKLIDKHLKAWREEPDVHYLKVIDKNLDGKMIAGAKWRINKKERTEEQIQSMLPVPGPEDEGRPVMVAFMGFLSRVRREFMGTKPFCFLQILVTDPEHHRRGAGAMLIEWGTEKADDAQLPSFLEATRMGRPLYERMGFEKRYEEVFDLSQYGVKGEDSSTVMIREPLFYVM
ncbi:hypothetical protein P153DRAFT_281459 [Dothidotthia symphoricarpi CBS 119687]|uniref:N-acetyltransferase domain-containing protein n=1 Tax=Dothidotthia symphoricarpi CBS 119687 TaxID=1392245 RepID=A0A6A6AT05_9PLEO|nr:uncharacterized protein P153DRAFT_281459 [Dothidotthia symphoricarpi CBS 119687]KAF2134105.1 hypothetical protein P153DRAFT_281459 [Dothidotthia symphoricarpi CBS 119687]